MLRAEFGRRGPQIYGINFTNLLYSVEFYSNFLIDTFFDINPVIPLRHQHELEASRSSVLCGTRLQYTPYLLTNCQTLRVRYVQSKRAMMKPELKSLFGSVGMQAAGAYKVERT
jgi:hypothetical protein